MPKFGVSKKKELQLLKDMEELNIKEADLQEQFIKGSGSGGQKINKTSSCVYLFHKPSGIEIKCQASRSQALNRFFARRELCERLKELIDGEASKKQQLAEKIKRQKRRRSRRAKQKILADKKHRAETKALRTKVSEDN